MSTTSRQIAVIAALIRLTIFIYVALWLYRYLSNNKLPIYCPACEGDGVFTRCTSNSGIGTESCARYKNVKKDIDAIAETIPKVKISAQNIANAFNEPIKRINETIKSVKTFASRIAVNMPQLQAIELPTIDDIDLTVDFTKIPKVDVCADIIQPTVNASLQPINNNITMIKTNVSKTVADINKALAMINEKPISIQGIQEIKPININCAIDLSAEFAKIGLTKLDIGKLIQDSWNKTVELTNKGLRVTQRAINDMLTEINKQFKRLGEELQAIMLELVNNLKDQLDAYNVFKDLVPNVKILSYHLGQLSLGSLIEFYVLPIIQSWFPGAKVVDVMIAALIFTLVSAGIYAWNYLKTLMMPLNDVVTIMTGGVFE